MVGVQRRRDPARILCAFDRHRVSDRRILNDGYHFSRCTRCEADLVEVEGGWSAAPSGYRIVWKSQAKPAPQQAEAAEESGDEPAAPVFQERRRLDRRVNPHAFAYKGKERRRNRDRRTSFGKKSETA